MQELDQFKNLDPVNRAYLEKYLRSLHMNGIRPRTIHSKLWRTYIVLKHLEFKDARTLTREDIENYLIGRKDEVSRRGRKVSPITIQGEILEVRLFLRWLTPEKEADLFPFKMKRQKHILPVDRLITKDEVSRLVEACTNQRDRALLMFLWDSAGRISEVMNLKIGDVQFDRYGAVVILDGKTGRRRLRLTSCVPDLQAWVNIHPLRTNTEAPLFVTGRRYGSTVRQLSIRTVENSLKGIARRAGVRNVHPHLIRHARLTDLTRSEGDKKGLSEMELRIVAGWEKSSAMPEIYVHMSGEDVEKKILRNAGLIDDNGTRDTTLDPRKCPRCGILNTPSAMYCSACSLILDAKTALLFEEKKRRIHTSEEYQTLEERLQRLEKRVGGD